MRRNAKYMYNERRIPKCRMPKHTDVHTQWTMNSNSRHERYIYLKVSTWFLIFEFCSCFACIHSLNSIRLEFGCNRDIFCSRLAAMNRWSMCLKAVHISEIIQNFLCIFDSLFCLIFLILFLLSSHDPIHMHFLSYSFITSAKGVDGEAFLFVYQIDFIIFFFWKLIQSHD